MKTLCLQVAVNRQRISVVVDRLVEDLPRQHATAQEGRQLEQEMRAFVVRSKELKRQVRGDTGV